MNCDDASTRLAEILTGPDPARIPDDLVRHLSWCLACRTRRDEMRAPTPALAPAPSSPPAPQRAAPPRAPRVDASAPESLARDVRRSDASAPEGLAGDVRREVAGRPGGFGASLAVLGSLERR